MILKRPRTMYACLLVLATLLHGTVSHTKYCLLGTNADIVIAVHDSANTMQHWWSGRIMTPGVTNFLRTFTSIFDFSRVQISLVTYGTSVREIIGFSSSPTDIQRALVLWTPEFGGRRTYNVIDYITTYMNNNARVDSARIAIFLTNTASDDFMRTIAASIAMRQAEIAIIGVAFNQAPVRELTMMTGNNLQQLIFSPTSFMLPQYIPRLKRVICLLVTLFMQILARRPAGTLIRLVDTILVMDHSMSTTRNIGLVGFWNPVIVDFMTQYTQALAASGGRCGTGITTFSDDATTHLSITTDLAVQQAAISVLALADAQTIPLAGSAISLGIMAGTSEIFTNANPAASKTMIVLLDGSPENLVAMTAAAAVARASGVTIYAVQLTPLAGAAATPAEVLAIAGVASRAFLDVTEANLPALAVSLANTVCLNQLG